MSRRPRSEMQFGSDSFLDVVANIVGILIILIVIAGLRVSQSPVKLLSSQPHDSSSATIIPEAVSTGPDEPDEAALPTGPNPAPLASVLEPVPRRDPPPAEPPRELAELAEQLSQDIVRLEQGARVVTDQTVTLRRAETELAERMAEIRGKAASKEKEHSRLMRDAELQRASLAQLHATAELLLKQIDEETRQQPAVETLQHRVTPLSRTVHGNEQHYRLIGNRVSEVPVTVLSSRLREQVERRRDWLTKQHSHQGTVGPVGGYTMNYVVQRENVGVLDEVRYGQSMVRISVSNWRIEPEPDLATESAAEALQPGSRFYDSLMTAADGTSLTFWVYPDSYGAYRQLQKFAHQQGFLVAGRPLPPGIPICGSPNGSKSAGQ